MPIQFVDFLESKLSSFQNEVSKDSVYAYLYQNDIENLLEEAKRLKIYFEALNISEDVMSKLNALINQIKQFNEDVL